MEKVRWLQLNVDSNLKTEANAVLNDLGLNMSTAINMFLTQVVKRGGIPFEISNPKPSREMIKALKEAEKIINNPNRKGYDNMEDLIKALDD